MTNPTGDAQALWNDLLQLIEGATTEKLKNYQPNLRKATGVVPPQALPTGGNTGSGYTPAPTTASNITDFQEAAEDVIGAALVAGANVTVSYNDATGKTTIASTASGSGDMTKAVYDTDNDGIVDAAESAPWGGLTGVPSTFAPSAHATSHHSGGGDALALGSIAGTLTDTQHGSRGGAALHSAATTSANGFMSAADKTKSDAYPAITGLTTGHVLQATGAAAVGFAALVASQIPNLDASKITTGQIAIANGGTGQATAAAAFDALAPTTTRGDISLRGASGNTRLAIGAAGRVLRSDGTDPSWAVPLFSDLGFSGLTTGQVPRATSATAVAFGALDLANTSAVTGTLPAANLPTASPSTQGAVRVGNDLAIATAILNRNKGTAFPGSPSTNDLFFRTDYRAEFLYDGSAWQQTSIGTFSGSFPATPVTNLRVYRADYDRTCHYDGTRWLSERFELPLAAYTTVQPIAASSAAPFPFLYGLPPESDLLLKAWRCGMIYIDGASASGGTNYWTITLRIEAAAGVTTLASFNTSNATTYPSFTYVDGPLFTSFAVNPVTRGAKTISIALSKTGTPGQIYLTPQLDVCAVIT